MTAQKVRTAARYLRVSRADQNPNLQADETLQLIERRGWQLVETYLDHGVSGSKGSRPELDRMLAHARKHRFDTLVVYRADRLFRSLKHMVVTLDELAALSIDFTSATENFDTTNPQGRLLLHLVSAFAEFERGVLIQRVRSGLDAAVRRGTKLGRPRARVDLDRARLLQGRGMSLRAIARELGIGTGTVQRALAAFAPDPNTPAQKAVASPLMSAA
jgi:DNA invertase Pin-like site-specific DNA recombinase